MSTPAALFGDVAFPENGSFAWPIKEDPDVHLSCPQLGLAEEVHELHEQLKGLDDEVLKMVVENGKVLSSQEPVKRDEGENLNELRQGWEQGWEKNVQEL